MMAAHTLTEALSELAQSQRNFLNLLDRADETALYQNADAEGWTPAMVMIHISEARGFFADELKTILASPGATVGRTIEDPHRLQTIADHGRDSPQEIRRRLETSHETVIDALSGVGDDDLTLTCQYVNRGSLTLAEFIQRLLVGHDKTHVQQVKELLNA